MGHVTGRKMVYFSRSMISDRTPEELPPCGAGKRVMSGKFYS